MKTLFKIKHTGAVVLTALLATVALAPSARAQLLSLAYEENFGTHLAGERFAGAFRINLQDFDMGSVYPGLGAPGTAAGYGANGTGPQTVEGGIATLNALQSAGATGAVLQPTTINGVAQPASLGLDDTWGIARIISITDLDGGVVWSENGKNQQLTVAFYGEKDFYVSQLADGFQQINGVGLHADLYLQGKSDIGYTPYDPFAGSAGRIGANGYTSVTDGNMILSTVSTPGFINNAGTLGGLATEFSSVYNNSSGGSGQAYLNVTGGSQAAMFNTDFFSSSFVPNVTADLFAQFTTVVNTTTGDWLVRSNDPITGNFAPVPEPSTYGLVATLILGGIVVLRRRNRTQSAQA